MSYKFFLGIGLLLGILLGCLLTGYGVDRISDSIAKNILLAKEQAERGALTDAATSIQKARQLWNARFGILASFSNHTPMDSIDALLAEAQVYNAAGRSDLFIAACARLQQLLESISQDHRLTWWNLL